MPDLTGLASEEIKDIADSFNKKMKITMNEINQCFLINGTLDMESILNVDDKNRKKDLSTSSRLADNESKIQEYNDEIMKHEIGLPFPFRIETYIFGILWERKY